MNKYKLILPITVLILVIILGGIFYWFEWRPSQIRKNCTNLVSNQKGFNAQKFADELSGKIYFDETAYKKCLRENGIN